MARELRREWLERIGGVEREYLAARSAADALLAALERGTAAPPANTTVRDANAMSDNLEGTFLIRLFAAFESGLRSFWASVRDTERIRVVDLINAVAARRDAPDDLRDEVHEVREYRNSLVHEGTYEGEPVPLSVARGRLRTFFARLPDEWSV